MILEQYSTRCAQDMLCSFVYARVADPLFGGVLCDCFFAFTAAVLRLLRGIVRRAPGNTMTCSLYFSVMFSDSYSCCFLSFPCPGRCVVISVCIPARCTVCFKISSAPGYCTKPVHHWCLLQTHAFCTDSIYGFSCFQALICADTICFGKAKLAISCSSKIDLQA